MAPAQAELIERIVREVLARLSAAPAPAAPADRVAPADAPGDLRLPQRVVTLAELPPELGGVRRVLVRPRAVVTPAVRDELQRRNVALEFTACPPAAQEAARPVRLWLCGTRFDPAPLTQALGQEGFAVQAQSLPCLIATTDQLAAELVQDTALAILLCPHLAAALCLANRHPGVRAILASHPQSVAREAQSVGANLLVLDPLALGFFALKHISLLFLRGGPQPCPEPLRPRLA